MEQINNCRCLYYMTDDALFVANTGRYFDRHGVIAICHSHLTEKAGSKIIDIYDDKLVSSIRESRLNIYEKNPNQFLSDIDQEKELQRDYGGRAIWELLQNADDAMAPSKASSSQLIGAKGIGFKSVLEITDEPEIYSGPYSFCFSPHKTQEALKEHLEKHFPEVIPLLYFFIPHEQESSAFVQTLLSEYATVICMPFKNQEAREKAQKWLEDFDSRILLFCQNIKELIFRLPNGKKTVLSLERRHSEPLIDDIIKIKVQNGNNGKESKYRRWAESWKPERHNKQLSVGICLNIDAEDKCCALDGHPNLHVFFPTEEHMPFRALIHASFDLDQSRKHVRDSEYAAEILSHLKNIIGRLVEETSAEVVLQAFVPEKNPEEGTQAYVLWSFLRAILKEYPFVPCVGDFKTSPKEARLWEYHLGKALNPKSEKVKNARLIQPNIACEERYKEAFEKLDTQQLSKEEYPCLLLNCRNSSIEECEIAVQTLMLVVINLMPRSFETIEHETFLKICRDVSCWWIDGQTARPLRDFLPLLRKQPQEALPSFLHTNVLNTEFEKRLKVIEERYKEHKSISSWNEVIKTYLIEPTKEEIFFNVLLPHLKDKIDQDWWEKHRGEILNAYKTWIPYSIIFDQIPLLFIESPEEISSSKPRDKIGRILRLPTNKGWIPANKCYAGSQWEGPESFDSFFLDVDDRGLLLPPDQWQVDMSTGIGIWKAILRYVGVSWEPKMFHFHAQNGKEVGFAGEPWKKYEKECWSYWRQYREFCRPGCHYNTPIFERSPRLVEQYAMEFFPECLPKTAEQTISMLKLLINMIHENANRMEFTYEGANDRKYSRLMSFAKYQVLMIPWLQCKPSLLHPEKLSAPNETYLPDKGIQGIVPEVDIKISNDQEGRDKVTFLVQKLGIRENLPDAKDKLWRQWIEKLPDVSKDPDIAKSNRPSIRKLYREFLNLEEKPEWLRSRIFIKVPCDYWDKSKKEAELEFYLPSNAFWMDRPEFAEPNTRNAILHCVPIFVLELDDGKKATDWLSIKKLSDVLRTSPVYNGEDEECTSIIIDKYRKYHKALSALAHKHNMRSVFPDPNKLDIRAVHDLRVVVAYNNEQIANPQIPIWIDGFNILVNAERPWRSLALALGTISNVYELSDSFENILRVDDQQEVASRLRESGVSESAIHDIGLESIGPVPGTVNGGRIPPFPIRERGGNGSPGSLGYSPRGINLAQTGRTDTFDGDAGKNAEEWLRASLKQMLEKIGWTVSDKPERDEEGRETDIVIWHKSRGKWHIEAKHVEHGRIYWSELEVGKAIAQKTCYMIAILRRNSTGDGYRVNWIWDPLSAFLKCERKGIWLWRGRDENVELRDYSWDVPSNKPDKPASSFSFRIDVSDEFINSHPEGIEELKKRIHHEI